MPKGLPLLLAVVAAGASGVASAAPITSTQLAAEVSSSSGLDWLLSHQNADGSFGTSDMDTAAAVIAISHLQVSVQTFAAGAIDPAYGGGFGLGLTNPFYRPQASAMLNKAVQNLWSHAEITHISTQPAGNPDVNGSGLGVSWGGGSVSDTSFIARAIAAQAPLAPANLQTNVITSGVLAGKSFGSGAQDIADWYAYGQTDSGFGRGGWYFGANAGTSEMSLTGAAVEALTALESQMGTTIPYFVRPELSHELNAVYDPVTGSYGLAAPGQYPNAVEDALGLASQFFLGNPPSSQINQKTLACIRGGCPNGNPLLTDYSQSFGTDLDLSVEVLQNMIATALTSSPAGYLPDAYALQDELTQQLLPLQNSDGSWTPRVSAGGYAAPTSVFQATAFNIDSLGAGQLLNELNYSATDPASVPEPSSLWLVATALFSGLAAGRQLRRRA